jgi:hypothetical protein
MEPNPMKLPKLKTIAMGAYGAGAFAAGLALGVFAVGQLAMRAVAERRARNAANQSPWPDVLPAGVIDEGVAVAT